MSKRLLKLFFVSILSLGIVIFSHSIVHSATLPYCANFADVLPGNTFYPFVHVLSCHSITSGYTCGGAGEPCNEHSDAYFRPGVNLTRAQGVQMVSLSANFQDDAGPQIFEDIAPGSTFYDAVNRLSKRGFISGYACGGTGEPCVAPTNRPYFRQNADMTRAQFAKITAAAAGFTEAVSGQTFEDIVPGSTFYEPIERLAKRHIVSGYACGGTGEPCVAPTNRPYFRQNSSITRQQSSQFVALAFFAADVTPNPSAIPSPIGGTITPGSCSKKSIGDADCNGTVDNIDYLYYVRKANGGTLPANVSADFNGDGETGTHDRAIIIATLMNVSPTVGTQQ